MARVLGRGRVACGPSAAFVRLVLALTCVLPLRFALHQEDDAFVKPHDQYLPPAMPSYPPAPLGFAPPPPPAVFLEPRTVYIRQSTAEVKWDFPTPGMIEREGQSVGYKLYIGPMSNFAGNCRKVSRSGCGFLQQYAVGTASNTFKFEKLTANSAYMFKVELLTRKGKSFSTPLTLFYTAPTPTPPWGMTATDVKQNSVHLWWHSPNYTAGYEVLGHQLYWLAYGDQGLSMDLRLEHANPNATIVDLAPGTEYSFTFRTLTESGWSVMAPAFKVSTAPQPGAPTNVRVQGSSASSVTLRYEPPLQTSALESVVGYRFKWKAPEEYTGVAGGSMDSPTPATEYTVTGLRSGTEYMVEVAAVTTTGRTKFSAPVPVATCTGGYKLDAGSTQVVQYGSASEVSAAAPNMFPPVWLGNPLTSGYVDPVNGAGKGCPSNTSLMLTYTGAAKRWQYMRRLQREVQTANNFQDDERITFSAAFKPMHCPASGNCTTSITLNGKRDVKYLELKFDNGIVTALKPPWYQLRRALTPPADPAMGYNEGAWLRVELEWDLRVDPDGEGLEVRDQRFPDGRVWFAINGQRSAYFPSGLRGPPPAGTNPRIPVVAIGVELSSGTGEELDPVLDHRIAYMDTIDFRSDADWRFPMYVNNYNVPKLTNRPFGSNPLTRIGGSEKAALHYTASKWYPPNCESFIPHSLAWGLVAAPPTSQLIWRGDYQGGPFTDDDLLAFVDNRTINDRAAYTFTSNRTIGLQHPPVAAMWNDTGHAALNVQMDVPGTYTLQLQGQNECTDEQGTSIITIIAECNTPPQTVATVEPRYAYYWDTCYPDLALKGGSSKVSAHRDDDNDIVEFMWTLEQQIPENSRKVRINDRDLISAVMTPDWTGTYSLSLEAFDGCSMRTLALQAPSTWSPMCTSMGYLTTAIELLLFVIFSYSFYKILKNVPWNASSYEHPYLIMQATQITFLATEAKATREKVRLARLTDRAKAEAQRKRNVALKKEGRRKDVNRSRQPRWLVRLRLAESARFAAWHAQWMVVSDWVSDLVAPLRNPYTSLVWVGLLLEPLQLCAYAMPQGLSPFSNSHLRLILHPLLTGVGTTESEFLVNIAAADLVVFLTFVTANLPRILRTIDRILRSRIVRFVVAKYTAFRNIFRSKKAVPKPPEGEDVEPGDLADEEEAIEEQEGFQNMQRRCARWHLWLMLASLHFGIPMLACTLYGSVLCISDNPARPVIYNSKAPSLQCWSGFHPIQAGMALWFLMHFIKEAVGFAVDASMNPACGGRTDHKAIFVIPQVGVIQLALKMAMSVSVIRMEMELARAAAYNKEFGDDQFPLYTVGGYDLLMVVTISLFFLLHLFWQPLRGFGHAASSYRAAGLGVAATMAGVTISSHTIYGATHEETPPSSVNYTIMLSAIAAPCAALLTYLLNRKIKQNFLIPDVLEHDLCNCDVMWQRIMAFLALQDTIKAEYKQLRNLSRFELKDATEQLICMVKVLYFDPSLARQNEKLIAHTIDTLANYATAMLLDCQAVADDEQTTEEAMKARFHARRRRQQLMEESSTMYKAAVVLRRAVAKVVDVCFGEVDDAKTKKLKSKEEEEELRLARERARASIGGMAAAGAGGVVEYRGKSQLEDADAVHTDLVHILAVAVQSPDVVLSHHCTVLAGKLAMDSVPFRICLDHTYSTKVDMAVNSFERFYHWARLTWMQMQSGGLAQFSPVESENQPLLLTIFANLGDVNERIRAGCIYCLAKIMDDPRLEQLVREYGVMRALLHCTLTNDPHLLKHSTALVGRFVFNEEYHEPLITELVPIVQDPDDGSDMPPDDVAVQQAALNCLIRVIFARPDAVGMMHQDVLESLCDLMPVHRYASVRCKLIDLFFAATYTEDGLLRCMEGGLVEALDRLFRDEEDDQVRMEASHLMSHVTSFMEANEMITALQHQRDPKISSFFTDRIQESKEELQAVVATKLDKHGAKATGRVSAGYAHAREARERKKHELGKMGGRGDVVLDIVDIKTLHGIGPPEFTSTFLGRYGKNGPRAGLQSEGGKVRTRSEMLGSGGGGQAKKVGQYLRGSTGFLKSLHKMRPLRGAPPPPRETKEWNQDQNARNHKAWELVERRKYESPTWAPGGGLESVEASHAQVQAVKSKLQRAPKPAVQPTQNRFGLPRGAPGAEAVIAEARLKGLGDLSDFRNIATRLEAAGSLATSAEPSSSSLPRPPPRRRSEATTPASSAAPSRRSSRGPSRAPSRPSSAGRDRRASGSGGGGKASFSRGATTISRPPAAVVRREASLPPVRESFVGE